MKRAYRDLIEVVEVDAGMDSLLEEKIFFHFRRDVDFDVFPFFVLKFR
jgi:hypothetical protein